MIPSTIELARQLMEKASVTPQDKGCQQLIADYLAPMGFKMDFLNFGLVSNLWARKGDREPLFVFAGHTDVVPAGHLESWKFPPFSPSIHEDRLYGRGAVDMKGALAAMLTACQKFVNESPVFKGSIGFLITSDEEGEARDGTAKVVEYLKKQGIRIDYCLIGEPTSEKQLGDTIKIGRRGSLSGTLKIIGKQGHIAYPHLAKNPVQLALPVLKALFEVRWDEKEGRLPPTAFQISNIKAGTGATNVIPEVLEADFNFRFSDVVTDEWIKYKMKKLLDSFSVIYEIQWKIASNSFYSKEGRLADALEQVIKERWGMSAQRSTSGGTSDGRFIASIADEMVELGLCNATIHQVNEHVKLKDLEDLSKTYESLLNRLLRF